MQPNATDAPASVASVVVPVYSSTTYISEAVESARAEDKQDRELVISDNVSNDNTRDCLRSLQDPRIPTDLQHASLGIFFRNLNSHLGGIAAFMWRNGRGVRSAGGDMRRLKHGQRAELIGALPFRLSAEGALRTFAAFGNIVGSLSLTTSRHRIFLCARGWLNWALHSACERHVSSNLERAA